MYTTVCDITKFGNLTTTREAIRVASSEEEKCIGMCKQAFQVRLLFNISFNMHVQRVQRVLQTEFSPIMSLKLLWFPPYCDKKWIITSILYSTQWTNFML